MKLLILFSFRFPFQPLTSEEFVESLLNGPNAKPPLDDKVNWTTFWVSTIEWALISQRFQIIKSYTDFGNRIDAFYYGRQWEMKRVQVEIDKVKEVAAKKKEAMKKKQAATKWYLIF